MGCLAHSRETQRSIVASHSRRAAAWLGVGLLLFRLVRLRPPTTAWLGLGLLLVITLAGQG